MSYSLPKSLQQQQQFFDVQVPSQQQSFIQQQTRRPDWIQTFKQLEKRANVKAPGIIPPEIYNTYIIKPTICTSVLQGINKLKELEYENNPWYNKMIKENKNVLVWSARKKNMYSALTGKIVVEVPPEIIRYLSNKFS